MSARSEKYDIVVGIPSYNEADTIGHVAEVAGRGLERYFPGLRSVVVNCDNRSPDGTKEAFWAAPLPKGVDRKTITTPEGVRGKGNNFWNLFRFCEKAEARAIVVVDADLRSITPEWIKYLGGPVLQGGYDFVAPATRAISSTGPWNHRNGRSSTFSNLSISPGLLLSIIKPGGTA